MGKKKIMIFIGSYLPGTKSAGVTTSVSNIVKNLQSEYEFYIVTADRDLGDDKPYKGVEIEKWTEYQGAHVFYSEKYINSIKSFKDIICSIDADMYYFNSFYNKRDTMRALILYKLGLIPQKPLIIAPRGIFSMGEFETKAKAKVLLRKAFKIAGFCKKTIWHATAELEKRDILKLFPEVEKNIYIAPNMSGINVRKHIVESTKQSGHLKIIFLSRVSEKKNIKYIIECLKNVRGDVQCDIYGMIGTKDDEIYWKECAEEAEKLPQGITVTYKGEVPHDLVGETFSNYDLFFFPTFGENYGHVIAESLANGCPVLLSDMTPWNDLERYNAGWSIPLCEKEKFIAKVQMFVDLSKEDWSIYSKGALSAAEELIDEQQAIIKHRQIFDSIL